MVAAVASRKIFGVRRAARLVERHLIVLVAVDEPGQHRVAGEVVEGNRRAGAHLLERLRRGVHRFTRGRRGLRRQARLERAVRRGGALAEASHEGFVVAHIEDLLDVREPEGRFAHVVTGIEWVIDLDYRWHKEVLS